MKRYTEAEIVGYLRAMVADVSQKAVSEELGFSAQFVNDILRGRRQVTAAFAARMGFEKLPDSYVKKDSPA